MTSINPINVNTQGVGAKVGFGVNSKPEKEVKKEAEAKPEAPAQKQVNPDQVFNYLSVNAAAVTPKKSIDPTKYVDEASAKRIGEFMKGFEEKVAQGLKAFDQEFTGAKVSDGTKLNLVLKQLDQEA